MKEESETQVGLSNAYNALGIDPQYQSLVRSCLTILRNLGDSLLRAKYELGETICESQIGSISATQSRLAKELTDGGYPISQEGIGKCIQFFKKISDEHGSFESYSNALLKLPPWRDIVRFYLPKYGRQSARATPMLPTGEFNVIYADPPWPYEISGLRGAPDAEGEGHYGVMEIEDIANLRVPSSESAILFLWSTNPKLSEALYVMQKWGFEYRTNMVWVKPHFGTGFYFRGQHELLLVGRKGDMFAPAENNRPSSVLNAITRKHSQKPPEVYSIIETMYPKCKYLELFARNTREGWQSWGAEIEQSALVQ